MIKHLAIVGYSETTLVFYRNLTGLLLLIPIISIESYKKPLWSHLKTQYIHFHLLRAIAGVSSMYCFFYIIANMPMAEASLIKLSIPFFLPIIAFLWLKDAITATNIIVILLGFIGVITILMPGSEQFQILTLVGLGGALLAAIAKVTIRRMGSTEPSSRIVFYFGTLATLVSSVPLILNPELPHPNDWCWFILMGLFGTLGQLSMTYAYKTVNPGKIGPYNYASLVYASLLGWLFWDELLTITTLIGSLLIITAGWINLKKGY